MKQSLFESRHQPDWDAFNSQLEALERGKAEAQTCQSFAARYRQLFDDAGVTRTR